MRSYIPPDFVGVPETAARVFQGELFDVYQWPQETFDGTTATFEMLSRKDTVSVIGVKGDKIIVTYQRQPRTKWFYAFPGGRNDHDNEDELLAAKREMLEETGMSFSNYRLIAATQPYSKIDWIAYTFLATDFESQIEQNLDAGEQIKVLELSFEEFLQIRKREDASRLSLETDAKSLDELLNLPTLN